MTMTEEDLIRLLESRHDIQATADPSKLTPTPAYQHAVAHSTSAHSALPDVHQPHEPINNPRTYTSS